MARMALATELVTPAEPLGRLCTNWLKMTAVMTCRRMGGGWSEQGRARQGKAGFGGHMWLSCAPELLVPGAAAHGESGCSRPALSVCCCCAKEGKDARGHDLSTARELAIGAA